MRAERKYVLSIAGFDPCGGAGLLADVKTFESNKVYGLGVMTANTFQNDNEFRSIDWISLDKILAQVDLLRTRFPFEYIKIGLIESLEVLKNIVEYCQGFAAKIIWDPIIKSSTGWEFHAKTDASVLESILSKIFLVTPNVAEAKFLSGNENADAGAQELSKFCHVYLKGGHSEEKRGCDSLFLKEGKKFTFKPKSKNASEKHGSGCVLSSAITANLAKGEKLHRACLLGKEYTEKFLSSNATLIGYHKL